MEADNTVILTHTHRDMSGKNEAVLPHVPQGGLQTAGEETAGVQSLQSPQRKVCSVFSTSALPDTSQGLGNLATYNEVLGKLNGVFDEQLREIQALPDSHWKSQEFPLARIKKIMRMDEEVKMISAEVPIMFSKAVEIFITELSLRAWLHTDEAKKRTLQRGDIAMAITKHDMFDFLIDIVPREEIQLKTRSKPEGDQVQVVSPELLQVLLQQLAQQQPMPGQGVGAEVDMGVVPQVGEATASNSLLQQQIQLIQQLVQLQMLQQEQHQHMEQNEVILPQVDHMLDLQQHTDPQAGGGSGALDHRYTVLQNMATSEHLSPSVPHQDMAHSQSVSGGQQTLHHMSEGSTLSLQDTVINVRPQPMSVVVQPPPILEHGPHPQYQGLQHLHRHHRHQPSVVVQVISGSGSGGVEFQHIPEAESISGSISPITAALHTEQEIDYSGQNLLSHGTGSSLQNLPRTS